MENRESSSSSHVYAPTMASPILSPAPPLPVQRLDGVALDELGRGHLALRHRRRRTAQQLAVMRQRRRAGLGAFADAAWSAPTPSRASSAPGQPRAPAGQLEQRLRLLHLLQQPLMLPSSCVHRSATGASPAREAGGDRRWRSLIPSVAPSDGVVAGAVVVARSSFRMSLATTRARSIHHRAVVGDHRSPRGCWPTWRAMSPPRCAPARQVVLTRRRRAFPGAASNSSTAPGRKLREHVIARRQRPL